MNKFHLLWVVRVLNLGKIKVTEECRIHTQEHQEHRDPRLLDQSQNTLSKQ